MPVILVLGPKTLTRELEAALQGEPCQVLWAADAEQALRQAAEHALGLAVLDLEVLDATDLARSLQGREGSVPILALVSDGDLSQGGPAWEAEDFLVKPWRPAELKARVKRFLARSGAEEGSEVLKTGDLAIDLSRYHVSVAGHKVDLTYMEYNLLKFLASHPGRVFSRETLLSRVWGYDYLGGSRTVDVHIRRLRSKLEDQHHSFIETVRNVGYRFKAAL
ncbi:MAG: response regulator transcription factor [Chloroflexi bacterium]|nr:response regulator transcription factor [Chloroflexota bacterium]